MPRANGYFIYRSDKKDGSYHRIKRIRRGKILSFRDTGRKFDKKFYYKIVAYGTTRDGKKALSPESRKVTSRPRAEVPSLKTANRDYRAIHLSWKKSTGTDGYEIYRSDTKNGDYQLIQTISQRRPRSWTDRELTVGKTYYYKMRSYCFRNGKHYYSELSRKPLLKCGRHSRRFGEKGWAENYPQAKRIRSLPNQRLPDLSKDRGAEMASD